jgi:hypothetical protein
MKEMILGKNPWMITPGRKWSPKAWTLAELLSWVKGGTYWSFREWGEDTSTKVNEGSGTKHQCRSADSRKSHDTAVACGLQAFLWSACLCLMACNRVQVWTWRGTHSHHNQCSVVSRQHSCDQDPGST